MNKYINYNNKNILVKRLSDESNKIYQFRYDYINDTIRKKVVEYKILEKNSKILANIKFKNCYYDKKSYTI